MSWMGVRYGFVWGFSYCSMVSVVLLRAVADWGVIFVEGSLLGCLYCSSIRLFGDFDVLLGFFVFPFCLVIN
jgi:hypothetical protein